MPDVEWRRHIVIRNLSFCSAARISNLPANEINPILPRIRYWMVLPMTEEKSDCAQPAPPGSASPMNKLPTLQRNALCKIFDRPEFKPEEVAALGYRRLQQAEGIGQKGLAEITAWLNSHGFELKAIEPPVVTSQPLQKKARKNIEQAVRLLRTHGYIVQPVAEDVSQAAKPD